MPPVNRSVPSYNSVPNSATVPSTVQQTAHAFNTAVAASAAQQPTPRQPVTSAAQKLAFLKEHGALPSRYSISTAHSLTESGKITLGQMYHLARSAPDNPSIKQALSSGSFERIPLDRRVSGLMLMETALFDRSIVHSFLHGALSTLSTNDINTMIQGLMVVEGRWRDIARVGAIYEYMLNRLSEGLVPLDTSRLDAGVQRQMTKALLSDFFRRHAGTPAIRPVVDYFSARS